jgi:hypothetical protein
MAAKPELQGLHEIHLPDPVSWLPQTVGWYAGLGILLLALAWWGYARWRRFAANRYRRLALAELADLARELQTPGKRAQVLRRLPELLKWTALSAFPRAEVASLTGARWLAFLDRTIGGTEFTEGAGRLLGELAYAPTSHVEHLPDECVAGLLRVARRWITGHGRVPDGSGRGAEIPGRRVVG